MQGKALVVNPAVIQPSAPPTIVVGRVRGEMARFPRVWTCDPTWRNTGKKTPEEPGRTRDTHGTHGIHGRTDHTVEPHNHPNPTTVDTPAPGRTTRRDGRYR